MSFTAATMGDQRSAAAPRRNHPHDAVAPNQRRWRDRVRLESIGGVDAGPARDDEVVGKSGMTERAVAGAMTAVWMENGCERPSYAPIVGSGINSTILHYSANDRTMQDGPLHDRFPRSPCRRSLAHDPRL